MKRIKLSATTIAAVDTPSQAYGGIAATLSIPAGPKGPLIDVVMVAATPEALGQAIKVAWPDHTYDITQSFGAAVIPASAVTEDEEL